jgi:hypothetical protein
MKTTIFGIIATLMVLGLLPFALLARSRASQSPTAPLHLVLDMDKQSKGKAQRGTPLFADGRFMRPQVEHTVAREDLEITAETILDVGGTRTMDIGLPGASGTKIVLSDPTTYAAVMLGRIRPAGMSDEDFVKVVQPSKNDAEIGADTVYFVRKVPAIFPLTTDFLKRGQERFNIYCAPCHGESGYGDGPVGERATELQRRDPSAVNGFVAPQNFHEAKIVARPDGHLFRTITEGIRNMPAYDRQISIPDRWAIIAYMRALQRSQNAP